MNTRSRFHVSMEGIALGDYVLSFTPEGTHHGIYVRNCHVISVKSGIVTSESLEKFSQREPLYIYLQKSDFTANEIVRRAESQIGAVIGPGSEQYFCQWCLRGLLLTPANCL